MQFQISGSQEVRKFVVGFIEEACKKDPNFLSRVMPNLGMLLMDESVDVRKRVIRALTFLYKLCLQWLSKVKVHSNISESHPHFFENPPKIRIKITFFPKSSEIQNRVFTKKKSELQN